MDSRRPQPVGCGGKNDSEGRNVILGWHTPLDVPIPSIHDFVALGNALDIATAMALWILADHSQLGVVARMTMKVMVLL